jgi:hypothetical protein
MDDVKKAIETTNQIGSSLSSLIPQLFFDVIARIIPGFAIIWSFYFSLYGLKNVSADFFNNISSIMPESSFFVFLITVVVFYIISIIFYGLWSAVVHLYCSVKSKSIECDEKHMHRFVEVLKASKDFTLRHDFIKLHAPSAGNRITKLKAEIHMSGALTVAFALCFILSLFSSIGSSLSLITIVGRCLFFLFSTIGLFFSNRHYSIRLCRSVGSYSALLGYEEDSFELPDGYIKC